MTPLIDIVFLLIIFFMVLCQFIVSENFPVDVPDKCSFADFVSEPGSAVTTITIMKQAEGEIVYAVGSEIFSDSEAIGIVEKIAMAIDRRLEGLAEKNRIVCLRADKDVPYSRVQYALAAISQSCAADIELAVIKGERPLP